jgi:hypothetical protein
MFGYAPEKTCPHMKMKPVTLLFRQFQHVFRLLMFCTERYITTKAKKVLAEQKLFRRSKKKLKIASIR